MDTSRLLQHIWASALDGEDLEPGLGMQLTLLHPVDGARTVRHTRPDSLFEQAHAASKRSCHALLGLHLRSNNVHGAGEAAVQYLVGVAADIDTRKHGVADEAALVALAEAPWGRPSVVIHSGGGLHVVWTYRELLDAKDPEDVQQHSIASRVVQEWLNWRLNCLCCDPTDSLTHSFRLPGTVNWKPERRSENGSFPQVRLLDYAGLRYDVTDLTDWDWFLGSIQSAENTDAPEAAEGVARHRRSARRVCGDHPKPLALSEVPPALVAVLEAAGIKHRIKLDSDGGVALLLPSTCPACKGTGGACFIVPSSGRLMSHRARKCPAGGPSGRADSGGFVGLELDDWVEQFVPDAIPVLPPDGVVVVDPLWAALNERIEGATEDEVEPTALPEDRFDGVVPVVLEAIKWASEATDRVAVVGISPPGGGKTTAVLHAQIEHAAKTEDGFALLMSSHRLAEEKTEQAIEIATTFGVEDRVVHMLGQAALCPHGRGLASVRRMGYAGAWRKLHQLACGYGGCEYTDHIGGIGATTIKIATHAHLDFLLETDRLKDNVVVIDELSALHEDIELIDRDFWTASGDHAMRYYEPWLEPMNAAAQVMVRALVTLEDSVFARTEEDTPPFVERTPVKDCAELLMRATGFELEHITALLERAAAVDPEEAPNPPRRVVHENDMSRIPRADLPLFFATVLAELRGKAGPANGSVACFCSDGYGPEARVWIEWRVRKVLPPEVSVVLLDATADLTEDLTRAAFTNKDVKLFTYDIPMPGPEDGLHSYWIKHRSLSRRRLFARRDGKMQITVKGGASVRNVTREAIRLAKKHLPAAPPTAVTAPRPATKSLEDEESILGQFRELAQEAGALGEVTTAYHWGLRGLNTLEDATLFINLGDPVKNLGAVREEARLFGLDPDDHAQRSVSAELIQALHRSRALRVTLDRPKVVVHAGRHRMIGFKAQTIDLGPGPARSDARRAAEDFAQLLLEHGGVTAHWLAAELLPRLEERCTEARGVLAGPAAAVVAAKAPGARQLTRIWRQLFASRTDIETDDVPDPRRPPGALGRPLRLFTRSKEAVVALLDGFDSWLDARAEGLLPSCCAQADGTPMERRPLSDKIPTDVTRGELVLKPTEATRAALRMIRRLL